MDELRSFLSGTSFFGGLPPTTVEAILGRLNERRVAKGEVLFNEGESGKSMYIVREGALLVRRHCTKHVDARLQMMRPGDFFGVTALIEMEPRPFSCVAEMDSLVYELTNNDLYALYKSDVKGYVLLLQNISRELCRRLRKAARRISELEDVVHSHGKDMRD
ncbi:MAG TPA: Crp/Fnr family transcriptional regulator [Myxococcales bacterium]|nr:Crp/Fnr family transcriptional regulator [Myxococcales bacterium]